METMDDVIAFIDRQLEKLQYDETDNVVWLSVLETPVSVYEPTLEEYEGYIGRIWMNAKKPSTMDKALDWLAYAQNVLLPEVCTRMD